MRKEQMMLDQLKRLDADRLQIDELLSLSAYAKGLRAEHEAHNLPSPEWLDDRLRQLNREITSRGRDALELRLKEVRAQQSQLLTPTEKREKLAAEEAELTKKLTGATA